MSLGDEVKDPWGYIVAGVAGGVASAWVTLPLAIGVGAAVLAVKMVTGLATAKKKVRAAGEDLPVVSGSAEARWVQRADKAARSFDDIASSVPAGPIAERVGTFGEETVRSVASVRRLAGQASAVRHALDRIDPRALTAERDRIARGLSEDPRLRAVQQRSLDACGAQLDAYQRLSAAFTTLLARLESGALGLEGLVARLAEVVALTETASSSIDSLSQVDTLATELEGLRAGLAEAEDVSTRAIEGLAPLPMPAPGTVARNATE